MFLRISCAITIAIVFLPLCSAILPFVITTWANDGYVKATEKAWGVVQEGTALDAIEAGCSVCEELQCDGTVGYGGGPNEDGETILDALIMDGRNMNVGAVMSMRRIKHAISVARRVLDNTKHSLLAGDLATKFAVQMGFKEESLETNQSTQMWEGWKKGDCQPNYWRNVSPDPRTQCGPYNYPNMYSSESVDESANIRDKNHINYNNHDTIGMVAIDTVRNIAAGTSTNGMKFKIPGRVGDSPIPGSGAYADDEVGGAAATGDGDVMVRFAPSLLTVEGMRNGLRPDEAAKEAVLRIAKHYPAFQGGIVAINKEGLYGAACHGMKEFPFTIARPVMDVITTKVTCVSLPLVEQI